MLRLESRDLLNAFLHALVHMLQVGVVLEGCGALQLCGAGMDSDSVQFDCMQNMLSSCR